jgi:IclR family transcriptional regulator, acetate operon repressor
VTETSQAQTIAAVERAADVLSLFARSPGPDLGVTEIAQELDLSKAVVHRILASFRAKEFIELDESTRRYRLGRQSLALGLAYLDTIDIVRMAHPVLRELVEASNETATLSLRFGDSRVYVDQVTPPIDIKMMVKLGEAYPLHAGGSSKAILAFLPAEEQETYLARPLASLTDMTVTDVRELRQELQAIRERGYSVSFGERQVGAGSVAAPLLDHEGRPVAVMSLCGPVERVRGEVDGLAATLLAATTDLSARLGYQPMRHTG